VTPTPTSTSWPEHPVVHEVNTAVWLGEVSGRAGRALGLGEVPEAEWDAVVPAGITVVWLMGVWARSAAGRDVALADQGLREAWTRALPDWSEADVAGSPYCIREYVPDDAYGGWAGLDAARAALRSRGAGLMLDWVPNHTGPDSPWLLTDPDAYVRGSAEELAADPVAFLETPSGVVAARGRDPFFPPWPDVVQLDPFSPSYRRLSVATLSRIADHADAVRCDMAMLMLDDVVERTWGERVGGPPARGYWHEVIGAVRARHPEFRFVAEAYWDREWDLQQVGFDHCYDKALYDRLEHGDPTAVRGHLTAGPTYQRGLVRFLENHDEPRSATTFAPAARERAYAVAVATLPGLTLWHEGQADGRQVFVPVFLRRRRVEPLDAVRAAFHRRLWQVAAAVRRGTWAQVPVTGWPDNASADALAAWTWTGATTRVLVVVNLGGEPADGVVHVGWPTSEGERWILTDLLDGSTYERDGRDLGRGGLYVAREGWAVHVLSARLAATDAA
jgi:hypothetical protein